MHELSITHNRKLRNTNGQRYQLAGSFVSVGSERYAAYLLFVCICSMAA